jgi:hypothetical protein
MGVALSGWAVHLYFTSRSSAWITKCDQPVGCQSRSYERRPHAERFLVLPHEFIEMSIGFLDRFGAGGWV